MGHVTNTRISTGKKKMPGSKSALSDEELYARFSGSLNESGLSRKTVSLFRRIIYRYYRRHARSSLPWRRTDNPYFILVSEFMLQQTQVQRVVPKYRNFISLFPDIRSLSSAPLRRVLQAWQGLGYNRRAMNLHNTAKIIVQRRKGASLPDSVEGLMELPGIGKATASAVVSFAFQKRVAFIETNIRRVFLHFFFRDRRGVSDAEILPKVEETVDTQDPRSWYYALMDYGAALKDVDGNPNRRSSHYAKQSPFHGSDRQIRGEIVRFLTSQSGIPEERLLKTIGASEERVRLQLKRLQEEGFIRKVRDTYLIR